MISQRHRKIIEIVEDNKIITIKELSKIFNISEMTIRRDINELTSLGLITTMNGRISKITKFTYDHYYGSRMKLNKTEKEKITNRALSYIINGNSIFFDGSSTCNYLIKKLSQFSGLTTITNSIINLKELLTVKDLKVLSIGGLINNEYLSVGEYAVSNVKNFYTDLFFFGTPGLHHEKGIFESNIENAEIKKTMINNSIKSILLADHSKFGKINLVKLIDISKIDLIITDSNIDSKVLKELKNRNISVDVV